MHPLYKSCKITPSGSANFNIISVIFQTWHETWPEMKVTWHTIFLNGLGHEPKEEKGWTLQTIRNKQLQIILMPSYRQKTVTKIEYYKRPFVYMIVFVFKATTTKQMFCYIKNIIYFWWNLIQIKFKTHDLPKQLQAAKLLVFFNIQCFSKHYNLLALFT